jgi:hypothetical protein
MKRYFSAFFLLAFLLISSCGKYAFNNLNVGDAKTIQIFFFQNQASLVEPKLSQLFTEEFRNRSLQQTNLILVPYNGDLQFSGEIVDYRIDPMSATAQQTAAQNRLTITINVRYSNRLDNSNDFEKKFSFYSDFDANAQLVGSILDNALDEILERIIQDILNTSLNNWET